VQLGFQVKALVRDPQKAGQLSHPNIELVTGNLSDQDALRQVSSGCRAVIHGAGAVRGSSQAAFDLVNINGTAAIIAAVKSQQAPPRLLLLSSLAAREPQLSWYAQSKRGAEQLLQKEQQLDWVILRPPAVYGPGDKEMLPVFQMMSRGVAAVPGATEARISLIHVTDLVEAIIACLQSDDACHHQVMTLCDGKEGGYSWHEMAALAEVTWSRRVRLWQLPTWLLDAVAGVNLRLAKITGSAPMLTPAKLRELRHPDWVVDNRDMAATGWTPKIDLQHGLEEIRNSAL